MASGTGISPTDSLIISLKLLRMLGLFPYTWKIHCQDTEGRSQDAFQKDDGRLDKDSDSPDQGAARYCFPELSEGLPHSLTKSKWMMLWSGFVYALFTLLGFSTMIVSIYEHSYLKEQLTNTLFVASMGVGSVLMLLAMSLMFYLIFKCPEVACVITKLETLMSYIGCSRRILFLDRKIACALVLLGIAVAHDFVICISIVVLSVTDHISLRNVIPYSLTMVICIIQIAVVIMVISIILKIADGYASILPTKLEKFLPSLYAHLPSLSDLRLSTTMRSLEGNDIVLPESILDDQSHSDSEISMSQEEMTLIIDYTYGLQCFQRIFNGQFGVPVTIIILKSIGNITIMLFSVLSHDSYIDGHFHLVIFFVSAVRDLICLILLCYAPEEVTCQVSLQFVTESISHCAVGVRFTMNFLVCFQRDRLRQAIVGLRMLPLDETLDAEVSV